MLHTIQVTQEDIDQGIRGDCNACPIARAALRCLSGFDRDTHHIWVDGGVLEDRGSSMILQAPLPPIAQQFIEDFDAGREVQPIAFNVDIGP